MTKVRVSAVSFRAGKVESFDGFATHARRLVDTAVESSPDFILFPELLLTFELMSMIYRPSLPVLFRETSKYVDQYVEVFRSLATEYGVHIVGGSCFKRVEERFYNTAHLFTPSGEVLEQRKCHLTPPEKDMETQAGEEVSVFSSEKCTFAILICYDLEFPETVRLAALRGAETIFAPSATMGGWGYWRMRHCAQARCVEDQLYVVHASLLGGPGIAGLDFDGAASILTPCDVDFPPKGILAEGSWNEEVVVVADLETDLLYENRENGAVRPLADRRSDCLMQVAGLNEGDMRWHRPLARRPSKEGRHVE